MNQNESISTPLSRITVIDALRGFALLGVILMHMLQHFGIYSDMPPQEPQFPQLDAAIQWLSQNVIMGRFINIFAFLFGLSFFIQMDRAAKKGIDFRKRFLWRMVILLIIGVIGNAFFTADILSIYAVFGMIMVFLFRFKNRVLMILIALLLLGVPRILITEYSQSVKTEQVDNAQQSAGRNTPPPSREEEKPSFFNSAKRNLTIGFLGKLNYQFGLNGRGYITFALFLLGLVVGRLRFFEEVHIRKKRNIVLFIAFVLAATAISCIINLSPYEPLSFRMIMSGAEITYPTLLITSLKDIHVVLFSGILALGFIILYQIKSIGKYLDFITPYGRMGLTNYEMQSILGSILFSMWGFGTIFGSWGITEVFALGLVVYAIQAVISKYWLKSFLYGPVEWLWRSATYLKLQPFKKR